MLCVESVTDGARLVCSAVSTSMFFSVLFCVSIRSCLFEVMVSLSWMSVSTVVCFLYALDVGFK